MEFFLFGSWIEWSHYKWNFHSLEDIQSNHCLQMIAIFIWNYKTKSNIIFKKNENFITENEKKHLKSHCLFKRQRCLCNFLKYNRLQFILNLILTEIEVNLLSGAQMKKY